MSLYGLMRTSVSGMNAQANRLATVADNIANAGTIGYKRATAEFSTYVLGQNSGEYNSGAVNTVLRSEVSRQGALRSTNSATDLAISGQGFFVVQNASGQNLLTRAGNFQVDSEGNLVNAAGNYLLGYDIQQTGAAPLANGFAGLVPINVGLVELQATATTESEVTANLPANADVQTGPLPSSNDPNAEYAGKTSLLVYDSLGNEKIVDAYFSKTGAEQWEVTAYDRDDATNGGFPYSSGPLATDTLQFDPLTGTLTGASPNSLSINMPDTTVIELDLSASTQLGADFQVLSAAANGSPPGTIDRVEVGGDGTVYGIFQSGYTVPIYQLALANVQSPNNLQQLPGNTYAVTIDSGDVVVGRPEDSGYGSIVASALEESNVDMASELTLMIESQRSYSANSKVFQTGSDLMDVLINLKR